MVAEIVVIGGGGHAKVVISLLVKLGWQTLGYTDPQDRGPILGVPCLGDDLVLPGLRTVHRHCSAVIGLGKVDTSTARLDRQREIVELGFETTVLVSPHAVVNAEVALGEGTMVLDGAVVNSGSSIGACCILNSNSTVEHDCCLGDDVHIAPGATVSGGVTIGEHCMIGAGATIVQGVSIPSGSLVGAGSTVIADLDAPVVYVGSPARRVA